MSQKEVQYPPGLQPGPRQSSDRPRSKSPNPRRSDASASGSREPDSRTPARRGSAPRPLDEDFIPLTSKAPAPSQTRQGPSNPAGAAPGPVDTGRRPDNGTPRDQRVRPGARPMPVEFNGVFRPFRGGAALSADRPSSEAVQNLPADVTGRQTSGRREPGAPNVPVMPAPTPTSEAIRRSATGRDPVDSLNEALGRQTPGRALPPAAPSFPVRLVQNAAQDVSSRRAPGAPNPLVRPEGTDNQNAAPRRAPAETQDASARRPPAESQDPSARRAPSATVQDVHVRQPQRGEASCSRAEPRPPTSTRDASARRVTSNAFKDVPASRAIISPPAPSTSGSRATKTTAPPSAPPRPHASDSPGPSPTSPAGLNSIRDLESLHTRHLGHLKKLQSRSQTGQVRPYVKAFIESYDQNIQQFKEKLDRDKERAAKRRCSDAAEVRCAEARKAVEEAEARCREAEARCRETEQARERAKKEYMDSLSDGNSH